ncbi:MAG: lysylphosphatidylglycerol synthase transmembrane domain-containing protein [Chloroflexota bacterium]
MSKNSDQAVLPKQSAENEYKIPWGRTIVGLLISAGCVWYFSRSIDVAQLGSAFQSARIGSIIWAVLVIVLTGFAKAWRWQWLYFPAVPKFWPTFQALMTGQVINLVSPIPRLGDVARLYQMQRSSQLTVGQTLGTIVTEKSFDLLLTVLLAVIIIPFFAVPDFISEQLLSLALVVVFLVVALYVVVFQAGRLLKLTEVVIRPLPERIGNFIYKLADRSLAGLAVLKNGRITFYLVLLSAGIGILSFLTPLLIFYAFDLPYGIAEALLMNAVLTLSISIPSAPGRIGTFETFVVSVLLLFGFQDEAVSLAYALVYHAVVVVPTLIIGGVALALSDWKLGDLRSQ